MYYETEQKRESYKRMLRSLKHTQKELFENTNEAILNSRVETRESVSDIVYNRKE